MTSRALMFADQVDSTRLLADIGDRAMLSVRRRLHQLLIDAVTAHNGRVFGDMGDGLAVAFESPVDAARAALTIQAAAADTERSDGTPIRVRVGVHHGEVIPNGDGFVGMAVHIAARLCEAAPASHVAASQALCDEVGSISDIRVTPFERRVLKGIAEPVDISLLTPSDATPSLSDPAVLAPPSLPSTPWLFERSLPGEFVGRRRQSDQLLAAAAASDEAVRLVLVDGEPGIGKTTLLHAVGADLARAGRACVVGRADEANPAPYREIAEILSHLIANVGDDTIADHVLRHGSVLGRLVPGLEHRHPELGDPTDAGAAEPERFRLFEAVTDLLRTVAARQPLVLLFEDLHWSGEASLALLRHLTRSVQLRSVLLIGSFRPTEIDSDADLASFLGSATAEPNVSRIHLEALGPGDVQELVADEPFAEFADQLHAQTAGNPLFLSQMIASLAETSTQRSDDGKLIVPDTVQELATNRVDRLGPSHRAVLADAAVLGMTFRLSDVEAISADYIDVLSALEDAERAGLVFLDPAEPDAYVFGHAVVRDALYQRISAPRRRRRHGSVADALIARPGDVSRRASEILRHIERSGVERPARQIIELAEAAAATSIRRLDLTETVRFRSMIVDALRRLDDLDHVEFAEALLSLARAETSAGLDNGRRSFVEAAEAARELGRWDLFAEAAVSYGGELKENQALVDVTEPVALLTEALEHETEPTAMRALLLTALATWQRQHVPYERRRELVDEALVLARELDDRAALATVVAGKHRALIGPNVMDEAWQDATELEGLAAELGDDVTALHAVNLRLLAGFELNEVERLDQLGLRLDDLSDRLENIEGKRIALLWKSTQAVMRGDVAAHRAAIQELDQLISGFPLGARLIMLGAPGLPLSWLQGKAAAQYELGRDFAPPFVKAFLAAESGQAHLALGHLDEAGGFSQVLAQQDYLFHQGVVAFTRTARAAEDRTLAAEVLPALLPYSGRNARLGLVAFFGAVDHHLGTLYAVVGEEEEARASFDRAIAQHRALEAEPFLALSLAEAALVAETGEAETLRAEALELANRHDLGLVRQTLDQV